MPAALTARAVRALDRDAVQSPEWQEACRLLETVTEFDYLTHVVFRLFENTEPTASADARYRIEVMFSPGACSDPFDAQAAADYQPDRIYLADALTLEVRRGRGTRSCTAAVAAAVAHRSAGIARGGPRSWPIC